MAVGMEWGTAARGGALTSETLSRQVRMQAQPKTRFRQLTRVEMALGAHNGDTVTFRKISNAEEEGRAIGEKERVPETQFGVSSGSISVREYSLAISYTWTLSLLAKLSVEDAIIINLMNDMVKVLDKAAAAQFRSADLVYTPTGSYSNKSRTMSANGTPAATATRNVTMWDVKNIIDAMRAEYNMPAFDGNDYICVATSTFLRGLKDDPEWINAASYGNPELLFSGETGRAYGCRFIEENNALDANLSGGLGEAIFIAWDAVMEIVAYAEEIQAKLSMEWGRDKALRWVWMGGFAKTWSHQTDGESRIIRVYSN